MVSYRKTGGHGKFGLYNVRLISTEFLQKKVRILVRRLKVYTLEMFIHLVGNSSGNNCHVNHMITLTTLSFRNTQK